MPRGAFSKRSAEPAAATPIGPTAVVIQPGLNKAGETAAAFASGATTIYYVEGVYQYEVPLNIPTGSCIVGAGADATTIKPQAGFPAGGADDPLNYLIGIRGTPDANVYGPLTAVAPAGSSSLALTAVGALAPGSFLLVNGHNNPAQEQNGISSGATMTLTEMVEVDTIAVLVANLREKTFQLHATSNGGVGTAMTVSGVVPNADSCLKGVFLDCDGSTVAVGVLCDYALRPILEDIAVRGLSRAGLELRLGTRNFRAEWIWNRLNNNCVVMFESAMGGKLAHMRSDSSGRRTNALGIPRACITCRANRPTSIEMSDLELFRGSIGIRMWSGVNVTTTGAHIYDMNNIELRARDADVGASAGGTTSGVGIDHGAGPIAINETQLGCSYVDVVCGECRSDQVNFNPTWWDHDTHDAPRSNCSILNVGASPSTAGNTMSGLWLQDCDTTYTNFRIDGCEDTINTRGNGRCRGSIAAQARAGVGNALVGIRINHVNTADYRFDEIDLSNFAFPIFFDATFAGTPDWTFTITRLKIDTNTWSDVRVCLNAAAGALAPGDVFEFDPTSPAGTRRVTGTGGPTALNGVNSVQTAVGGYFMGCSLPARFAAVNVLGAGNCGDWLEANAANQAVPNNAAVLGTVLGRLMLTKAAGAAVVDVGTVQA